MAATATEVFMERTGRGGNAMPAHAGLAGRAFAVRYDDGGVSGGTLERPALKRLLKDIAEGRALGDTTTLADPNVVNRLKSEYEGRES